MPEFLAETYTPRFAPGTPAPGPGELAQVAAHARGPGGPARFLGAIAVPEEETCFWLYQAPTTAAVCAAMTAAGLRPERIMQAVALRPPTPTPGAAGTPASRPHRADGPALDTGPP